MTSQNKGVLAPKNASRFFYLDFASDWLGGWLEISEQRQKEEKEKKIETSSHNKFLILRISFKAKKKVTRLKFWNFQKVREKSLPDETFINR